MSSDPYTQPLTAAAVCVYDSRCAPGMKVLSYCGGKEERESQRDLVLAQLGNQVHTAH